MMKSALLFRLGGLGDLIVALPSLNLLRKALPGVSLHLVGRAEYGDLLREAGVVEAVFSAEEARWAPLFDDSAAVPTELNRLLSGYALILGWFQGRTGTPHFFSEKSEASPSSRPPSSRNPDSPIIHSIVYDLASGIPISRFFFERTAEAVKAGGHPLFSFDDFCRLRLIKEKRVTKLSGEDAVAENPRPRDSSPKLAVVHPGSGSRRKCWPLDRFLAVISYLRQHGFAGSLVTGEAEERLEGELRRVSFPPGWQWLCRPSLAALAGLLRDAALYIGNDSGVTHLAAACGTNVVAIFRKEMETAWKPFGRTTVLSVEEVEDISLEDVLATLSR